MNLGAELAKRFATDGDGWDITEKRSRRELTPALESVFAVANGYLGVRGTPEEGAPAHETGLALNGFHETWPIVYPEDAYGLARTGQTIVQAPDSSVIRLFVDDEPFELETARLLRFERSLDMRGVISPEVEFETARGTRMLIRSRRFASLQHRHLVAFDYTNLMAKENLEIATRITEWLAGSDPDAFEALAEATGPTHAEVDGWRRAAELMYIPRHEELGIVLQEERFLERKRWDFENTPAESYPLLLNYHPLELYRHQVIKQTDVVLATYLVGHHFSEEEKRRTFDYYDPLTTGDSSLSAAIQSVIASEVGYADAALDYFLDAVAVDLADTHGNTADGIHIASAGGSWLALIAGFAGLRDSDGEVHFHPRLPESWTSLRFRVQVRGQVIEVDMTHEGTTYTLVEGRGLLIYEEDRPIRLLPEVEALAA